MFWKWGKKREPTREQLKAEGVAMVAVIKPFWIGFAQKLPVRDAAPLSARMKEFLVQMRAPIAKKFPDYKDAPDKLLLNVIFVAVLEANTHSTDAIEHAMVDIEAKDIEADLKVEAMKIVDVLKRKWIEYQQIPFRADMPLTSRVESFMMVAGEAVPKNYPVMRAAPPGMIWEMVWVAVIESKTHSVAEVNAARASLGAKTGTP